MKPQYGSRCGAGAHSAGSGQAHARECGKRSGNVVQAAVREPVSTIAARPIEESREDCRLGASEIADERDCGARRGAGRNRSAVVRGQDGARSGGSCAGYRTGTGCRGQRRGAPAVSCCGNSRGRGGAGDGAVRAVNQNLQPRRTRRTRRKIRSKSSLPMDSVAEKVLSVSAPSVVKANPV